MTGNDTTGLVKSLQVMETIMLVGVYLLPASSPLFFGWVVAILPLPVFYFLTVLKKKRCLFLFRNSLIIAGVVALASQSLHSLIFSLTMVPLGFSLHRSVKTGDNYLLTGAKQILILSLIWLGFLMIIGMAADVNPYSQLIKMLDETFVQMQHIYTNDSELPAETIIQLEKAITILRATIPKILPGILASMLLLTAWINVVLASHILRRIEAVTSPWPLYRCWKLPESLIWPFIAGGAMMLTGTGTLFTIGLNIVIVLSQLYLFQGAAIMFFYLDKWSVPRAFRYTLYALLALQSYGLIILILIGLADVWMDIRKLDIDPQVS